MQNGQVVEIYWIGEWCGDSDSSSEAPLRPEDLQARPQLQYYA